MMSDDIYGTAPAKTMEAKTTHTLSPPPTVLPVPFYTLLLYLPPKLYGLKFQTP
jgi:hypothetical protein